MHEYGIVSALLAQVEREAARRGAQRVHRLVVQIGELSGVEIDLLETAYDTFKERSICADTPMEVRRIGARWACPGCDRAFAPGSRLRCDPCGRPARLVSGDEIVLERLELEVEPESEVRDV